MTTPQTVTVPQELIDYLRERTGATLAEASDVYLAERLALTVDPSGAFNMDRAALRIWEKRAADSATLVDVSESGSSRKFSDVHKNAVGQVAALQARLDALQIAATTGRSRMKPIIRGGS